MSAYGHMLEREFSAQSFSGRGGSERESHYVEEPGFFMSSFAAIIMIAALASVGVLVITFLVTLITMLLSCESRNEGVVALQKSDYDQNDCKMLALNAELNTLEADHIPLICRALAIHYVSKGQYARDLNSSRRMVENYFGNVTSLDDGLDVVLMDIDDNLYSESQYVNLLLQSFDTLSCRNCIKEVKLLKHMLMHRIYMKLHASGWPIILISRKPEIERNATIENLMSAGYTDWFLLIMRSKEELHMDIEEYFSRRRTALVRGGFRIIGVISSHLDALSGPYPGKRVFKIPNPPYYNFEHQDEGTDMAE